LFTLFAVFYYLFSCHKIFDSIPIGIEALLIIFFSFYYIYEKINDLESSFIYNIYSFWVALGFMVYLSGSFFIYLFAAQTKEVIKYWFITDILLVIKDIFFAIAIIVKARAVKKRIQPIKTGVVHLFSPE
jgi:hypothetical protein